MSQNKSSAPYFALNEIGKSQSIDPILIFCRHVRNCSCRNEICNFPSRTSYLISSLKLTSLRLGIGYLEYKQISNARVRAIAV